MNIDISGINVHAVNTFEDGNSVAKSNIEIRPI